MAKKPTSTALGISKVPIDSHSVGTRWVVTDIDQLAKLIAIVAMGQARHAATIIAQLNPTSPQTNHAALRADAKRRLTFSISATKDKPGSRWHRDGLIFEVISWCAAHQSATGKYVIRDPHLSATMQGLDGLMLQFNVKGRISRATIFEDKCSKVPRRKFKDEVLKSFTLHHANGRASDLVAAANTLLAIAGVTTPKAAARVLHKKYRGYRAALTVDAAKDTTSGRKRLFKGYDGLDQIKKAQRIGATFVVPADLRKWFSQIARNAKSYIDTF